MVSFLSKDDLDDQIEALISQDYQHSLEYRARILALGLSVIACYLIYDLTFPVFWFLIYGLALKSQVLFFSRIHARSTKGQVLTAVIAQFLIAALFITLPIYLLFIGGIVFEFAAFAFVFCAILHNISMRARVPVFAAGEAIVNTIFLVCAGYLLMGRIEGMYEKVIVALIGVFLIGYYGVALFTTLQMRHALRMASRNFAETQKMQALGLMTGGVAHDFNNILTVVMGNLDLHRETRSIAEKDQLAIEAFESAKRASALVAQLLAFSRQANLVPEAIDVKEFVDEFWEMAGRVIPATIKFHAEIPVGLPPVMVDRNQFEAAVLNLVLNARDAMPNGGEIRVTCALLTVGGAHTLTKSEGLVPGNYVEFFVSDSGTGIPWHIRKQVFDPFFTTKKTGQGSGLGLSMAKGFAEQSHGALTLDSQAGAGTVIKLILPVPNPQYVSPIPLAQAKQT